MKATTGSDFFVRLGLAIAVLVIAQSGTFLVLRLFGLADEVYSDLIINAVFLVTCIGYIRLFHLSPRDVGLRVDRRRLGLHVGLSLAVFLMYVLYYLFVVRISGLRPLTSATLWGLSNYLVVSCVEEIYFRGILYHVVEQRTSKVAGVLVSGLLFGLAHVRQGMGALPKLFSGWLWGSVRYATGMIFLLIFPVHFAYNTVWLLFEGNWETPSLWANLLPLLELLIGVVIIVWTRRCEQRNQYGANCDEP